MADTPAAPPPPQRYRVTIKQPVSLPGFDPFLPPTRRDKRQYEVSAEIYAKIKDACATAVAI